MEPGRRLQIPPLSGSKPISAMLQEKRREFAHLKVSKILLNRLSPASSRGPSPKRADVTKDVLTAPGSAEHSFTDKQSARSGDDSSVSFLECTTELLREHVQTGNRIGFKAMSSAFNVTRNHIIESKGGKALLEIKNKERRETRLPAHLYNETEPADKNFPCPLRSLISLKGKLPFKAAIHPPKNKADELFKILRMPSTMKRKTQSYKSISSRTYDLSVPREVKM